MAFIFSLDGVRYLPSCVTSTFTIRVPCWILQWEFLENAFPENLKPSSVMMSFRPENCVSIAEFPAGGLNHLQLLFQIVALRGCQERKIQIAQIMVYGSASGGTSGQKAALLLQKLGLALPNGVLIPSDDYRMIVLPEIEHHVAGLDFVARYFSTARFLQGFQV